ncbi:endolytic transglycosylase MltG [Demequina sp. NBRC 110054]|uniref:endolytic transglycosylase MltG n=1 Tax=Demequina sp. NBRC 110054 TaxID=1570343 RepID=UPI0009FE0501|nr:endolytic transglycosylase MltG [Demequina sp. NBRC 110054]
MSTLHDALAQIQHGAEPGFASTRLGTDLGPVRRRVRRDRGVAYAAGTVAVAAVSAGALYGYDALSLGATSVGPAGTGTTQEATSPSPTATASSPADGGTILQDENLGIVAGSTASEVAFDLAERFDVEFQVAFDALKDAAPEGDPEGWVAPGVYELPAGSTLDEVAAQMIASREPDLEALGVTDEDANQVLTLASLIEREAKRDEDRAMISAVLHNRLEQDMALQLDSTVKYLSGDEEVFTSDEEREIDSPYNTYLYQGLPPGPIANPSDESIEAALDPADSDALYFVMVDLDTGETLFASDYDEHLENVALLQEWFEANG